MSLIPAVKWKQSPKVLVLGFDGMDFHLTKEWLKKGCLPHLNQLANRGGFKALQTTNPAVSPVAWSSFLTGCNPGKHGIYDFINVNTFTLWPDLSTLSYNRRQKTWQSQRKLPSIPELLTQNKRACTSMFVPISFPAPEKGGNLISGMETPDLLRGQGTFTFITTDKHLADQVGDHVVVLDSTEEQRIEIGLADNHSIGFHLSIDDDKVVIRLNHQLVLKLGVNSWSEWVELENEGFNCLLNFYCSSTSPHLSLYVSPVQYQPGNNLVSSPAAFGDLLAKQVGLYPTLGYPYDTAALEKGALDDLSFLEQVKMTRNRLHDICRTAASENEAELFMAFFLEADAVQHMFWRALNFTHPLHDDSKKHKNIILETYMVFDSLVGAFLKNLGDDCHVFVLSDHGFQSYKMSFDVNRWLFENGYLVLKEDGCDEMPGMYSLVDWDRTRAYSFGMGRISVNLKSRERQGIVNRGSEKESLLQEISEKLKLVRDPFGAGMAVSKVWQSHELYHGDYLDRAPDLTIGFNPGYRSDSSSAMGGMSRSVITQNRNAWSGDHASVDPEFIPGVLFTNHPVEVEKPGIVDMAPTIMKLLDVTKPAYMDGDALY